MYDGITKQPLYIVWGILEDGWANGRHFVRAKVHKHLKNNKVHQQI